MPYKGVNLKGVFVAPYTISNTVARTAATLTFPAFNPANVINAPAGATHMRVPVALACVSDFACNDTTSIYEPVDAANNELSAVAYSGYIDLFAPVATSTAVTATLPGTPTMTADARVVFCIGIEFYQKVGTNYYLLNSGNALKIVDIF